MGKHRNKKRNLTRCQATGKIINGRGAIIADVKVIIEYLQKQGYEVKRAINLPKDFLVTTLLLVFLFPLVSANPLFTFDFSTTANQTLLYLLFGISGFLYIFKKFIFSGVIILFSGLLMVFNDINLVVSMLVLIVGVLVVTTEE